MKDPCAIFYGLILIVKIYLKLVDITGWALSPRGAGYLFGQDVTELVTALNNI